MLRVCSKNTFLDFVEFSDDDEPGTPFRGPAKSRSFGFESTTIRPLDEPEEDPQVDVTAMQLERLNMVLDLNQLQDASVYSPKAVSGVQEDASAPEDRSNSSDNKGPGQDEQDLSELLSLQQRLGQALASAPAIALPSMAAAVPQGNDAIGKLSAKDDIARRVSSNTSISTMANTSDDGSDTCELPAPRRMPKAWSSGSVCTMVSEMSMTSELSCDSTNFDDSEAMQKSSSLPPEFSHSQVPRNQNLAEEFEKYSQDSLPTTMMIRNIPSRYSQNDLMMDLRDLGFTGSFDFLYMPMDKGTASNVGYAFVNFIDHHWAAKCMECFQDYRFRRQRRGAGKVASVSVAHMQGLEKNLQHYENAAVNTSKQMQRRPVIIANISNMLSSAFS